MSMCIYIYIYIYIAVFMCYRVLHAVLQNNLGMLGRAALCATPNLPTLFVVLLRLVGSNFPGINPMGMEIPPLKLKIMLESNPPKSRLLVQRLAVRNAVLRSAPLRSTPPHSTPICAAPLFCSARLGSASLDSARMWPDQARPGQSRLGFASLTLLPYACSSWPNTSEHIKKTTG